jgi:hypothetical protein
MGHGIARARSLFESVMAGFVACEKWCAPFNLPLKISLLDGHTSGMDAARM